MVSFECPPGSPDGIRALASIWRGASTSAAEAADTLDSAKRDVSGGALKLQGDFAPTITGAIALVPGELRKLSTGYQRCAAALEKYAGTLQATQRTWGFEAGEYDAAVRERQFAEWDLDRLAPSWTPYRDPSLDLDRLQDAVLNGQPDLGPQIAAAWRRRTEAQTLADTKDRLAGDAVALREEAEGTCASEINAALDEAGIRDKNRLQKFLESVKDLVPSWAGFVKFCETLSTVLGVVAMFAGPLAPILGAIAAAAMAVVVLDKLLKLASGELSWKQMAGELAMVAANRFGGKAVGAGLKAFRKTGLSRQISGFAHRRADQVLGSRFSDQARNRVHRQVCRFTGHPVDIATGKVYTSFTDLELPGPLPLTLDRVWFSTSTYTGPLGHGWHHAFDAAVLLTADETVYRTPDGRYVDLLPLLPGGSTYDRQERLTIIRDQTGYRISGADGIIRRFAAGSAPVTSPADPMAFTLREMVSGAGHRITCTYDDRDRLVEIVDSGGREIGFAYDEHDQATALTAPHPDRPGERFTVATYAYDQARNLVAMTDARGHVFRYAYEGHLLVEETDRTGLTFHFRYDGTDETARCTSTWGDGDLYRRSLAYQPGSTLIVNSLGHATRHDHEGGLVVRTIDTLGGQTRTDYDYAQPVEETDALGRITTRVYDWRGNQHQVTTPDRATVTVDFDQNDRPVRAVDQVDGEWNWDYDATGLATTRRDPLGRTTRMEYARGLLERITDPAGGQTLLRYDTQGSLVELTTPDGAVTAWDRNVLGWPVATTDPIGNPTRRVYDLGGNITRVEEPDGNVRAMDYDGEANLTSAVDVLYDVRLTYQGMGRLASKTQAGTTVRFEYDTEEQLTAVVNEHGHVYSFSYNPTGLVQAERSFGDVLRVYERDIAGRIVSVRRASGIQTRHDFDGADRITRVHHSDGTSQRFDYRADGALLMAGNDTTDVHFERDVLGRLLRERQGEHWVASEYDTIDSRVRMSTSKGADQHYTRNAMGDVTVVEGNGYSIGFTLDLLGRELTREISGIRGRWYRDELGRPVRHEVTVASRSVHDRAYQWGIHDRLLGIVDAMSGSTRFEYDGLGQLVAAFHSDGTINLRTPDDVGNLFRTDDRVDRVYGPAGQLLESVDGNGRRSRYVYDSEGNVIAKDRSDGESWQYRWHADGQLAAVIRPDGDSVDFAYDGLGRRVSKTYLRKITRWIWDGNDPVQEWTTTLVGRERFPEKSSINRDCLEDGISRRTAGVDVETDLTPPSDTRVFDDQGDLLLEVGSRAVFQVAITDHIGSLVKMVNAGDASDGGAAPSGDHMDAGTPLALCPVRARGRYNDPETNLDYNRHRYLDPTTDVFMSPDPIGIIGGLRLYAHVRDPNVLTDPLGLASCRTNARRLRRNLNSTDLRGNPRNPFNDGAGRVAAHLVPSGASQGHWQAGQRARDLLKSYNIDVNDMANGVFLPKGTDGFTHSKGYLEALEKRLTDVRDSYLDSHDPEYIREALLFHLDEMGFHTSEAASSGLKGVPWKWPQGPGSQGA
jgi:RHS repeat-associated protein